MKPKLEDVAKKANVSKTTVSRVLNNRGYLSRKTIEKVHQAMQELNYQPNAVARQLFKQQTQLIGLLFPTVANPFFGELTEALETRLYKLGFKVIVGNSMHDAEKETNYLNQLLSKQVDGLIVGTHNQGIQEYQVKNLPIVAIDRIVNEEIPIIESDNYAGGVLACERLIKKGARHILHTNGLSGLETPAKLRQKAYEETMKKHGLSPNTITVDFESSYEEKHQILSKMLEDFPKTQAVFASNDIDAALLLQIANEKGLKVPEDLMIIGYDGTKMIQNILPQLTTIVQPIEEVAEMAIQVLLERMDGIDIKQEYKLPVYLKEGKTG